MLNKLNDVKAEFEKELALAEDAATLENIRVAYLGKKGSITELLKGMFSNQAGDYITTVDESNVILIKQLEQNHSFDDLLQVADTIVDMINTEIMTDVRVAFGSVVKEVKDVS